MISPIKKSLAVAYFLLFNALPLLAQIQYGGEPAIIGQQKSKWNEINTMPLPTFNLDSLQEEDRINDKLKGAYRFGYNHFVSIDLLQMASVVPTDSGTFFYTKVISNQALSLNFAFNKYHLIKGCRLFIVDKYNNFIGSLTEQNNTTDNALATDVLFADEAVFELFIPNYVNKNDVELNLFRVTHGYRDIITKSDKSFGSSDGCNTNINCPDGDNWQLEKRAVACIIVNGNEKCTGSLINNTANDGTPYFLTANHCGAISTNLWVFRFNWESKGCQNENGPMTQTVSGAQVIASNANSDFLLLKLNTPPPAAYNLYLAGWDRTTNAPSSCTAIHHPSGDIKKISTAAAAKFGTYNTALCWQTGTWDKGATEPGSSGCPLFNPNNKIIGQLYGGPSACDVSAADKYDMFGRFDQSWDFSATPAEQLKIWLDPLNVGSTTFGGYALPGAVAVTASINRIRNFDEAGAICTNSIAPTFFITNEGNTNITAATILVKADGAVVHQIDWTGVLARYESALIQIPAITNLQNGSHHLELEIYSVNGDAGYQKVNGSIFESDFNVSVVGDIGNVPFLETFSNSGLPKGWSLYTEQTSLNWEKNNMLGAYGENTGCVIADNYSNSSNIFGKSCYLISPVFNVSTVTKPILLSFDLAYATRNAARQDSLLVMVSTNCGANYSVAYRTGYTDMATTPNSSSSLFVPNSNEWKTVSVSLDEYYNGSTLQLLFENKSGWGGPVYLDNIRIDAPLSVNDKNSIDSFIRLYPNPSAAFVSIQSDQLIKKVIVRNLVGQEIKNESSANVQQVDVRDLENGIYFFELYSNASIVTKKVVVSR